jgi:hypothetical protein
MKLETYRKSIGFLALSLGVMSGMAQGPDAPGTSVAGCREGAACAGEQAVLSIAGVPVFGFAQVGVISTGGAMFGVQENAEVVKNQPYQAQAVTEIQQTLSDGSHIRQTTTATVARDSDGRTVRIQKLTSMGPWKSDSDGSEEGGPTLTTIFDPVAKVHIHYTSDTRVAHEVQTPPLSPSAIGNSGAGFAVSIASVPGAGAGPTTFAVQGHAESPDPLDMPAANSESLGTKTIDSISVTGTRTTSTIRAHAIGNDRDIAIVRDTWYAPDLRLVVQSSQNDPRFGKTTYTLTNIERNEPDATLFQVPAGYTVDKVPVMVHTN